MRFVPQRILRLDRLTHDGIPAGSHSWRNLVFHGQSCRTQGESVAAGSHRRPPSGDAMRYVKHRHPFRLEAWVVLPEHLHCIWTLPPGDSDFSTRWNLLKGNFSRSVEKGERISCSRAKRRERGLWQRRYWEHLIRDQEDFNRHIDYIHWNPVKHGWANRVSDWPHSSFHAYVARGVYPITWGHDGCFEIPGGE